MKRIFYIITILLLSTSCSKVDKELNCLISISNLQYGPDGGEQVVEVSPKNKWTYEYESDWVLVRQQQDRMRVIVEPNGSLETRSDIIRMIVNGSVVNELLVVQDGVELDVSNSIISVGSQGDSLFLPIVANTKWEIDNKTDWCEVHKDDSSLFILVARNYKMEKRSGVCVIGAGDVSLEVEICQSGCQWFESFEMINVEGGTFYMGAQAEYSSDVNYDAVAYQIEAPVHQVSLDSYAIGKFEVTQAQWEAAMGNNPSENQGENLPVENVSWEDVNSFILILNDQSGLNYRLPTEAEWEFAAKGGNLSKGFIYSGSMVLSSCGWYYSNGKAITHDVGGKCPNELGLYDMSGNVREWCNDWFGFYSSSLEENPQGPYDGRLKVNRGGSWTTPAVNCRNSYRHTNYVDEAFHDLGFRLALAK